MHVPFDLRLPNCSDHCHFILLLTQSWTIQSLGTDRMTLEH